MTARLGVARMISAVAAVVALLVVSAAAATAATSGGGCAPGDLNCVGVGTGSPGGGPGSGSGGHGGGGSTGGGGSSKPDPCAKYPGPLYTACKQSKGQMCLNLYDQYSASLTFDQLNTLLTQNSCPAIPRAQAPPPSPATLAQRAAASFELPNPSGDRSPSPSLLYEGYPFTWVNLYTFYWSSPGTWKTFTATARAGGNYAAVTAKPVSLSFDPGDGSAPVSCAGPGRPWVTSDGNGPPTQGACAYQYSKVTGPGSDNPITSMQTITWQLTWTGSGNTSGTLTSKSTSTSGKLNVMQIQTVNCDPHGGCPPHS